MGRQYKFDHLPGSINMLQREEFVALLRDVTDLIYGVLSEHCGPNSMFAMICDPDVHNGCQPKFTKDGINTLSAVELSNPAAAWILDEFRHIGRFVAKEVGDGTTTSMMLAAHMARELPELFTDVCSRSYADLRAAYESFVNGLVKCTEKYKITPEVYADRYGISETEAVHKLVFHQTMTSSHFDVELSQAIADLLVNMPRDAVDHLYIKRSNVETPWRYRCERSSHQFDLPASPLVTRAFSSEIGKALQVENCAVIACIDPVGTNTLATYPFFEPIDELRKAGTPVVLLLSSTPDERMMTELMDRFFDRSGGNFEAYIVGSGLMTEINELSGLVAVADMELDHICGISKPRCGITVKYADGFLSFDNLYPNPDNSLIHPKLLDGTEGTLYRTVRELDFVISEVKKNNPSLDRNMQLNAYCRVRNRIKYTSVAHITIGGNTHDNNIGVDVVEDAVRAAAEILDHGALLASNVAVIRSLIDYSMSDDCPDDEFSRRLLEVLRSGFKRILLSMGIRPETIVVRKELDDLLIPIFAEGEVNVLTFRDAVRGAINIPLQPFNLTRTMLARIGESILPMLKTGRLIIPGASYVGSKTTIDGIS